MTPKVLNRYKDSATITDKDVYIGRPSRWGNRFVIGKDGDRAEVIAKHKQWVYSQPDLLNRIKRELKGKNLVCFCSPQPCHGDTLLEIANGDKHS